MFEGSDERDADGDLDSTDTDGDAVDVSLTAADMERLIVAERLKPVRVGVTRDDTVTDAVDSNMCVVVPTGDTVCTSVSDASADDDTLDDSEGDADSAAEYDEDPVGDGLGDADGDTLCDADSDGVFDDDTDPVIVVDPEDDRDSRTDGVHVTDMRGDALIVGDPLIVRLTDEEGDIVRDGGGLRVDEPLPQELGDSDRLADGELDVDGVFDSESERDADPVADEVELRVRDAAPVRERGADGDADVDAAAEPVSSASVRDAVPDGVSDDVGLDVTFTDGVSVAAAVADSVVLPVTVLDGAPESDGDGVELALTSDDCVELLDALGLTDALGDGVPERETFADLLSRAETELDGDFDAHADDEVVALGEREPRGVAELLGETDADAESEYPAERDVVFDMDRVDVAVPVLVAVPEPVRVDDVDTVRVPGTVRDTLLEPLAERDGRDERDAFSDRVLELLSDGDMVLDSVTLGEADADALGEADADAEPHGELETDGLAEPLDELVDVRDTSALTVEDGEMDEDFDTEIERVSVGLVDVDGESERECDGDAELDAVAVARVVRDGEPVGERVFVLTDESERVGDDVAVDELRALFVAALVVECDAETVTVPAVLTLDEAESDGEPVLLGEAE